MRAKHEVRAVNPGLNEFKRQFTQIKKKARVAELAVPGLRQGVV